MCRFVVMNAIWMMFGWQVAEMIPGDWSVALLSQFLLNSVRSNLHEGRMSKVSSRLALREYLLASKELLEVQSTRISLTDNRLLSLITRISTLHFYSCSLHLSVFVWPE